MIDLPSSIGATAMTDELPIVAKLTAIVKSEESISNIIALPLDQREAISEAAAVITGLVEALEMIEAGHGCPSAVARNALESLRT